MQAVHDFFDARLVIPLFRIRNMSTTRDRKERQVIGSLPSGHIECRYNPSSASRETPERRHEVTSGCCP